MKKVLLGPIAKRFAALAGGSVIGQALMFVALPIATLLYTPEEFGALAAFSSIIFLFLPAICLRWELAIPIREDERDALNLVWLSLLTVSCLTALIFAALTLTSDLWSPDIMTVIDKYGWLIALTLWGGGVFSILQYWAIRLKSYRPLAWSHITRGALGASTQLGLGALQVGPLGLLVGQGAYIGSGSILLAVQSVGVKIRGTRARFSTLVATARQNWRFPIFSTPEALLNSSSQHLPMLLIISLVSVEAGGLLFLAQRFTSIPVGIIGGNLSRVFIGEAPERMRIGELFSFTKRLMAWLFWGGLPIAVIAIVAALTIPTDWLPPQWAGVLWYFAILVPGALLQLTAVPVSTVLIVRDKQFIAMCLQTSGLLLQVSPVILGYYTKIFAPIEGFALGMALHYGIYSIVVLIVARAPIEPQLEQQT